MDVEAELVKHLQHLCVEIGPRPVGSRANQAAADYIRQAFQDAGLQVEMQAFPCPVWEDRGTGLELDGQPLQAAANAFSPPCDVSGVPVAVGTLAELEATPLTGRIGLLYADLSRGTGLSTRGAAHFPERDREILHALEQKHPAALITVNQKRGCLERLIRDWAFHIPSITVPAEVGLQLLQHSDAPLKLTIDSHCSASQFCNVIATKPGARRGRIVLCAHFDTMHDTPGASDNGAGVAVLLASAALLASRETELSLEWIALNGEENGGLGDAAYLRQRGAELDEILVLINVDGAGQRLGANSITLMGGAQPFQEQLRALARAYPGVVWSDPWYESDHSAFYARGVPCIPISSAGAANVTHFPADTVEWVSPVKMHEVLSLIEKVVLSLQDKAPEWCRAPTS